MKQRTLLKEYSFEGKGLHSGKHVHMTLGPAPVDTGIRFIRTDIGENASVDAVADNVSRTFRSTILGKGRVSVRTVEHVLSALTGLGVDNAVIRLDSSEVPILDGSARLYAEAILADGLKEQEADRKWLELKCPIEVKRRSSGAYIRIVPADEASVDCTIDFNSHVLGIQKVHWDDSVDYGSEVAPCRTFCFVHELMHLSLFGLVKGGDVDNAIVIVEKPISKRHKRHIQDLFRQPDLEVGEDGYLVKSALRFPDECGRHKLLDLLGDLRLSGGFLKARVEAYKPGHRLNTQAAKLIRENLK